MDRDVTDSAMNPLDQGNVIVVAVHYLPLVDGDILTPVCCQQPREQAEECLILTLSLGRFWGGYFDLERRLCCGSTHQSLSALRRKSAISQNCIPGEWKGEV